MWDGSGTTLILRKCRRQLKPYLSTIKLFLAFFLKCVFVGTHFRITAFHLSPIRSSRQHPMRRLYSREVSANNGPVSSTQDICFKTPPAAPAGTHHVTPGRSGPSPSRAVHQEHQRLKSPPDVDSLHTTAVADALQSQGKCNPLFFGGRQQYSHTPLLGTMRCDFTF